MRFEFDPEKNRLNQGKHEISFEEAQEIWSDEEAIQVPAMSETEDRFAIFGEARSKIWSAFFTYRGEAVRIISVRRARKAEVELYESGKTR